MKIKELKELKGMEVKELEKIVLKKKLELMKNQVKMLNAKEKDVKQAKKLKKEISQILTVIKEKGIK